MASGVERIQREVRASDAAVILGQNTNLDLGIAELDAFQHELGAPAGMMSPSDICAASQLPDIEQFHYPKILLIDNPLQVVGVSGNLSMPERLELIDMWVRAASTGPGRCYPLKVIARLSVASNIQQVSWRAFSIGTDWTGKSLSAAEELVDTFDGKLPIIGPLIKKGLAAAREKAYDLGSSQHFTNPGSSDTIDQ